MKNIQDTVDSMCLTFSVTLKDMFGEAVEFDLCKDGRERAVDGLNKFEFVELYSDFLLNKSIEKSVGFLRIFFYRLFFLVHSIPKGFLFGNTKITIACALSTRRAGNDCHRAARIRLGRASRNLRVRRRLFGGSCEHQTGNPLIF